MAKLSLVVLQYLFMFDPEETWSSLHAFETDLAKMFNEHGIEATIVKAADGQQGLRVLYIKKKQELQPLGVKDMPGRRNK